MNERLKQEIESIWSHDKVINPHAYDKGEEIQLDKRNLETLAQHFYNLALEEVKKEVEKNLEQEEWAIAHCNPSENEKFATWAQMQLAKGLIDFIDNLTK